MTTTRTRLVAVLLAAVVGASVVGVAAAASAGSITADPATPGATSTHTVTVTAGNASAGSWNGLSVDYAGSGADASSVGRSNVEKIGIDRGSDEPGAAIDVNVSSDLSDVKVSNEGRTLTFKLGGSYSLSAGDELVVVYSGVENPSETGSWRIGLDVNPQSSGGQTTAALEITSADSTTTTTQSDDTTTTRTDTTTTTEGGGGATTTTQSDGGSGASSPGFGVAVALAGAIAAALLALRR